MKPAAKSLLISASTMATRELVKLHLLCATMYFLVHGGSDGIDLANPRSAQDAILGGDLVDNHECLRIDHLWISCLTGKPFLKAEDVIRSSYPTMLAFHLESFNVVWEGLIMLLAQVEQVVDLFLDCLVGSVLLCEDESQLFEVADRPVWHESPLKYVKEGIENRFSGAVYSISVVNGEEFT
ncbi:unnamed protein product [Prunus brigantina]